MTGSLKTVSTPLSGLLIVHPEIHEDERGFLMETFNERSFIDAGLPGSFFQDVHSRSQRNVLRGLHIQCSRPLGKLVRVSWGEVFDVAVDLRRGSPTFGHSFSVVLSGENRKMLYVPPGFAHGFCVLSEWADLLYKFTGPWEPLLQRGIRWNDPKVAVSWPLCGPPILSRKDDALPFLAGFSEGDFFDMETGT